MNLVYSRFRSRYDSRSPCGPTSGKYESVYNQYNNARKKWYLQERKILRTQWRNVVPWNVRVYV